jgi:anti-sigma B factor antagonist
MNLKIKNEMHQDVQAISFSGKILSEADLEILEGIELAPSSKVVFDLSELTHINSSGINFIVKNLTRCRINNGELILCGLKGNVLKIFELSKVNSLFTIYNTIEESINYFTKE